MPEFRPAEIEAAKAVGDRFLEQLKLAVEKIGTGPDKYIRRRDVTAAQASLRQVQWLIQQYPFLKFHDLPKVEQYIEEQAILIEAEFPSTR